MNQRQLLNSKYPWYRNEEEKKTWDPKQAFEESLFQFVQSSKNGQPLMALEHASNVIRLLVDRVEALEAGGTESKSVAARKAIQKEAATTTAD